MSKEEEVYRKEWMSDEQWRLSLLASKFCHGFHHCFGLKKWGSGICFDAPGNRLATYDCDGLTSLVAIGHANLVRVGVQNETKEIQIPDEYGGGVTEETKMIISMHSRIPVGEDTRMHEHHPTLRDNLARLGFPELLSA